MQLTCDIGLGFAVFIILRVSCDIFLCKHERTRLDYTACKLNTVERSDDLSNNCNESLNEQDNDYRTETGGRFVQSV